MGVRDVAWVSEARFAPFLRTCEGNEDLAWELYEWNARVASALFECFHHAEVLLRNAMIGQLQKIHPLAYPWQQELSSVTKAAERRRDSATRTASPDSIISELTLGFWTNLLEPRPANDELWRQHLRHAFPCSPGVRATVHKAVTDMRNLRNRCAHQDSLLEYHPAIELKKLLSLVEWIDPAARTWIDSIQRVEVIAAARPVLPPADVVVVGARADEALRMYETVSAYVCPSDRFFAPVTYLGFYSDKRIEPYFPKIEDVVVPTRWSESERSALSASSSPSDQRLAEIMGYGLSNGWQAGEQFQVFFLSRLKDPSTLRRPEDRAIVHRKSGRGSAFVQYKRYFAHSALLAADDTDHLI